MEETHDESPGGPLSRLRGAYRRAMGRRWVRWSSDALIFGAVLLGIALWQTRDLVPTGDAAPAFTLSDLEGRTWSSEDLRGKKVVLTFFAPWCGVCAAEAPVISSLHRSEGERARVVSIAVSYEDDSQVRAFAAKHGVEYPVLLGNSEVRRAFRVNAFPTTYVITEDGRIEDAAVGYTTGAGLRFRLWF